MALDTRFVRFACTGCGLYSEYRTVPRLPIKPRHRPRKCCFCNTVLEGSEVPRCPTCSSIGARP